MNSATLNKLNALAATKGLKVEAFSYYYQLKSDKKTLYTIDETYTCELPEAIELVINNLVKVDKGWCLRQYEHVWQSNDIYYDAEGYLQGKINSKWVDYNYSSSSISPKMPDCYSKNQRLAYLGYLDVNSPKNREHNNTAILNDLNSFGY